MSVQIDIVRQVVEVQIVDDQVVQVAIWDGVSILDDGDLVGTTRIIDFVAGTNTTVSAQKVGSKIIVTVNSTASGGTSIQFQDEGVNLGNNEADTVDFVGAGVTATRTADKITVTIPGSSAAAWGSITGTLSDQTDLNTALGLKAPLASPPFTGTPTAPTAALGTSTTQIATTAFVQTEIEIIKNLQQIGGMGLSM